MNARVQSRDSRQLSSWVGQRQGPRLYSGTTTIQPQAVSDRTNHMPPKKNAKPPIQAPPWRAMRTGDSDDGDDDDDDDDFDDFDDDEIEEDGP
mmetsp:Transcript_11955/g.21809  ORF Transcript_11955/g.21809 Transcript_11955/m.21809 type:complete len:93 (+) Transcript_11955:865-1143(+)